MWLFSIEFITYDSFLVHTSSHRENKNIKKFIINCSHILTYDMFMWY